MSKYIIDVGDAYTKHICGEGDMLCLPVRINEFEDNWLNTNIPLTLYTEPDTDKVREEAYEQGKMDAYIEDFKNITMLKKEAEEAYQRGLSDAWAAARKLVLDSNHGGLTNYDIEEIFGVDEEQAIINYSASEAIEKIRQHEQEKEEQIQVGDEVAFHHDDGRPDTVVVVTYIGQDGFIDGMDGRGTQYAHKNPKKWTKTGRDFPEIAAVLEKMRGGQDG